MLLFRKRKTIFNLDDDIGCFIAKPYVMYNLWWHEYSHKNFAAQCTKIVFATYLKDTRRYTHEWLLFYGRKKDLDQYGKLNLRMCNLTKMDDIALWSDTDDLHVENIIDIVWHYYWRGLPHFQQKLMLKCLKKAFIGNYDI